MASPFGANHQTQSSPGCCHQPPRPHRELRQRKNSKNHDSFDSTPFPNRSVRKHTVIRRVKTQMWRALAKIGSNVAVGGISYSENWSILCVLPIPSEWVEEAMPEFCRLSPKICHNRTRSGPFALSLSSRSSRTRRAPNETRNSRG